MGDVRVVQRRLIYRGRVIRLVREVLAVQGRRMIRETVRHPGAVVIVPMVDRSHMVFVRQYRRAVGRELLELPAGTLSAGERPAHCARRELQEEIGWRARRWRRLGQFYPAPGFTSEQMTVFLAQDLQPVSAPPDPDELIHLVVLSLRAALRSIQTGRLQDAKSIIAIFFALEALKQGPQVGRRGGSGGHGWRVTRQGGPARRSRRRRACGAARTGGETPRQDPPQRRRPANSSCDDWATCVHC